MYKIIGGDGREYGPITKEQLQQWIAEGRADAQTRVKAEGSNDWKPLASLPEFTGAFATVATPFASALPPPAMGARPVAGGLTHSPQRTSGLAIASLVLGIVGFFCSIFTSIPGIILGIVGLGKISKSGGALTGKGLAIAGIVVSIFALAVNLIVLHHVYVTAKKTINTVRSTITNMPKYSAEVDRCVGERMAEETVKLLNEGGEVVVLSMAGGKFKSVVAEAQLEGFKNGLASHEGIHIAAVEGPAQQEMMEFFEGVSEKFFRKTVSNHPNAKAIVSFMGLPIFAKNGPSVNAETFPQVIALNLSAMGQWKSLVSNGVVSAVILPRYDVRWDQLPKMGACPTLFDSRYLIVNQENYAEMAEKLKQFYPTP